MVALMIVVGDKLSDLSLEIAGRKQSSGKFFLWKSNLLTAWKSRDISIAYEIYVLMDLQQAIEITEIIAVLPKNLPKNSMHFN